MYIIILYTPPFPLHCTATSKLGASRERSLLRVVKVLHSIILQVTSVALDLRHNTHTYLTNIFTCTRAGWDELCGRQARRGVHRGIRVQ